MAILLPFLAPRVHGPAAPATAVPHRINVVPVRAVLRARPAMSAVAARRIDFVVTQAGQTVEGLAVAAHADAAAIRWANGIGGAAEPPPGRVLRLPPGAGALVAVLPGELPAHFAARVGVDVHVLLAYNSLGIDTPRPSGTYLQVPAAVAMPGALHAHDFALSGDGVPVVVADHGRDGFPYGQCTFYAAQRRNVTWAGNAGQWFAAARAIRPVGHVPVAGAIVVFDTGRVGHVAYVESVKPDGSFVISEMNFRGNGGGWGRIDHRTILPASARTITGFIY